MKLSPAGAVRKVHDALGRYLEKHGTEINNEAPKAAVSSSEAAAFLDLLAALGHHNPAAPLYMLEAFLAAGDHVSAEGFSDLLTDAGHETGPEEAARALELFTAMGFAEKHFAVDGHTLYEYTRPGLHHDHIICSGCGRATEFHRPDVDHLIEHIACDEDYRHLNHRLVIYGLCADCRKRREEGIALTEAKPGEMVVVADFTGPEELKRRLGDLGLRRGSALKIVGSQFGAMIVFFGGCRLAIGAEMAASVLVRQSGRMHCGPHHHLHHGRHGLNSRCSCGAKDEEAPEK